MNKRFYFMLAISFNGRHENEIKRKEMVQFLIDLGAQTNILVSKKRSLLHQSAESRSNLLLDLFLRQNLSVNGEDCDGNTPFIWDLNQCGTNLCKEMQFLVLMC